MFYYLFSGRPLLIAAAVIPAVWLLVYIYKKDRLERESRLMLLLLAGAGAVSTMIAEPLEILGDAIASLLFSQNSLAYDIFIYFIVVAFAEEGAKYLLLKLTSWKTDQFNCRFDGIGYACFVSLGFALVENVKYVLAFGFGTALLRAATAVPGHACFGVFMGAWYGQARRLENNGKHKASRICRRLAVLNAALLHGFYDFIATREDSGLMFWVFVAILFLESYVVVKRQSAKDRYI